MIFAEIFIQWEICSDVHVLNSLLLLGSPSLVNFSLLFLPPPPFTPAFGLGFILSVYFLYCQLKLFWNFCILIMLVKWVCLCEPRCYSRNWFITNLTEKKSWRKKQSCNKANVNFYEESVTINEKDDLDSLSEIPANNQTNITTTTKCSNLHTCWNNIFDDVKRVHCHMASMF